MAKRGIELLYSTQGHFPFRTRKGIVTFERERKTETKLVSLHTLECRICIDSNPVPIVLLIYF